MDGYRLPRYRHAAAVHYRMGRLDAMNESDYKTAFVKQARAIGWYARRIEDKYQVGVPDMWVKAPSLPFFIIEVKLVDGHSYAPSPRQLVDLNLLHEPPNAYGVVLGVERTTPPTLYWSEPRPSIDVRWPQLFKTRSDFTLGLKSYYQQLRSKQ